MMGATYLSLLAALKQDETLNEALRQQRSTVTIQRPSGRSRTARLLRSLRGR